MDRTTDTDRPAEAIAGLLEARLNRSDCVAVEDAIGEFFAAYNALNYNICLEYIMEATAEDRDRLAGLLKVTRNLTGMVTVQTVNNIQIEGSKAVAVLSVAIRSEANKKTINLVKQGNFWKLDWNSIAGSFMLAAQRRISEETQSGG
jgi:hypothetical protein